MGESFQGLQQLLEVGTTVGSYGNCWKLEQLLEAAATVGSSGNCWKLWQLLEAATGCQRGLQYDGKCSFYFNYFFCTTPTNRDLRQKAIYFPARRYNTKNSCASIYFGHKTLFSPNFMIIIGYL